MISRLGFAWTPWAQVNNAVVRSILQGCSALRQLYLDGCRHVTDAGFHLQQSPFYVLVGAVSLETISVQGCPQVCDPSARKLFPCSLGIRRSRGAPVSRPRAIARAFGSQREYLKGCRWSPANVLATGKVATHVDWLRFATFSRQSRVALTFICFGG